MQERRQRTSQFVLHQHRRRIHSQLQDQDPQLLKQPHVAVVQVELVPNSASLPDLRRHQDYGQWLGRLNPTNFEQSSCVFNKGDFDFDHCTYWLRITCFHSGCDVQLKGHDIVRSDSQDRGVNCPARQLEHSICACAVCEPIHHRKPALVDKD